MQYRPQHAQWFAATQDLFNRVGAFYFEVISAHEGVLDLSNQEALTALETLTHATKANPSPVMPLSQVAEHIPALFRRAAIHAALGSARSFYSHLAKWRVKKEQAQAKGKKFTERPPVPPRRWKKPTTLYAGQWKDRRAASILLKLWTGTCWCWIKVRITGRPIPPDGEMGSPTLVRSGNHWWLHTPLEKPLPSHPRKIEQQISTNKAIKICAVDLNLGDHLAVCTIQTVEGTILATRFIGGGQKISGFRKKQLGRIARNRSKTGLLAKGEQENIDLWRKLKHIDEEIAHLVSVRIVQFATAQEATILVFEHLGHLKPERGKYSRRGNSKRAFWMKGRIFKYATYKAWNAGIVTGRVNPRNTSRACARCHGLVARYKAGRSAEVYTPGAPLVLCPQCNMRGHADRNASLVIGQHLVDRYRQSIQEKPPTPLATERVAKATGVVVSQDVESTSRPSTDVARHGDGNGHGTAQDVLHGMAEHISDMPRQLRLFNE